jgi:hypothetical protein
MPTRPVRTSPRPKQRPPEQHRSEDDPRIMLDREVSADLYEPI